MRYPVLGALIALVIFLGGCAERGSLTFDQGAAEVGSVETILVASSRAADPAGPGFGAGQGQSLGFARFDVSVPPDRAAGTVRFPTAEATDARTDFLTVGGTRIADRAAFVRDLDRALLARPADQREVLIFVHGFNTNFAEGLYRQAQMRHDFRSPGVSVHFAWPSAARARAYATDRETALQARDDLEDLLSLVNQSRARRIVLLGHSMGAFIVMETVRQAAIRNRPGTFDRVQTVVLMAPDVDIGVFRRQAAAAALGDVSLYVFTSSRDRALRLSAALRGSGNRLGALSDPSQVDGLPVTIIDLTDVNGNEDALNHFKVATSPVMISLLRGLGSYGTTIFEEEARKATIVDAGVGIVRDVSSIGRPAP